MNKKITISKATKKVSLSMVYFLFFLVQLHFQYQSASLVDFSDNTIANYQAQSHLHAHKGEIKNDFSFVKYNRLNKRYHPEWPISIVDFFNYSSPIYQVQPKEFYAIAFFSNNIFLSTYLLRGPPANV